MGENHLMARLRVYAPNGALTGSLPHPLSWEAGVPLNDMPSLTMTYPSQVRTADQLLEPCEVALELCDPRTGEYAEYPGCRYLNLRRSRDLVDRPGTSSFTMPSYGWQLRKVRFADPSKLNKDKRIRYVEATPGKILSDILEESKGRGNIPEMGYSFTAERDSAGHLWTSVITGEYDLGADAWAILDAMSRQGLVDWRFNRRDLEVYIAETILERDLTHDSGLIFHSRVDPVEEPTDRTWEEVAPTILVIGDESKSVLLEADPATVDSPWGAWEETYSAGGVSDTATMTMLAKQVQLTRAKSRLQLTKRIAWRDGSPVPLIDYRPGDMLLAQNDEGVQNEPMRVHQITLSSLDPYGISAHLTLNDRFTERTLRTERWLNRITGRGGPGEGGGTGSETKPPEPDIEPTGARPAVPVDLAVSSQSYFDEFGAPVGQALMTFDAVTTDVDGEPLTPGRYMVYARRDDLPFDLSISTQVEHPDGTQAGDRITVYVGPLDAGHLYHFSAAALSQAGFASEWAVPVSAPIEMPTDPAPVPSPPILSSRLSTVKVEWDGLTELYEAEMPPRFREVQVEMSTTGSSPWVHVGEIFQGGSALVVTGQDSQQEWSVGDTLWFRFRSRDSANNISEPSEEMSVVVVGVEGPDIEANSITANHIVAGSITAEQIAAHSLTVDRLSVGDISNLIADPLLTDEGDADPDNPGQTVGGLNRHRVLLAEALSAPATTWSVGGGLATMSNGTTSNSYNRFPLVNNVVIFPDLVGGAPLERPGLATQVTRPNGGAPNAGNLMGRCRLSIAGASGMPGGATIQIYLVSYCYDRTGSLIDNLAYIVVDGGVYTGNTDLIIQSTSGLELPEGVAYIVPAVYVACEGGVPTSVVASFSEFEFWQEQSVFIGDGMIKAPLIEANAITTDKLDAYAITAKHTITGSLFQTAEPGSGTRVLIGPSVNYLNQPGIKIFGETNEEHRAANIFVTDGDTGTGTGGWDANEFVITGPNVNAGGGGDRRADLQLQRGGGWSIHKTHAPDGDKSGMYGAGASNEVLWEGSLPRGNELGQDFAVFRALNTSVANGSVTWGFNNGWAYRPFLSPNTTEAGGPAYSSAWGFSASGMSWHTGGTGAGSVTDVNILAYRGGYLL